MVPITLSGSVVAKMNMTCSGGSSTIFRSALKPCGVTMWASSRMKIL
ncbi:unknown [Bifidobacterium adolescentis CAG:119]|nr:unknown [Bifidobacterium adolescentis CAG:119]